MARRVEETVPPDVGRWKERGAQIVRNIVVVTDEVVGRAAKMQGLEAEVD
jgi:hypothetical protein